MQNINLYRKQEAEANHFTIELLAPRFIIDKKLIESAKLQHIVTLSKELQISKEAVARRYVECSGEPIAIIFTKDNRITSKCWSNGFPYLSAQTGQIVRSVSGTLTPDTISPMLEADPQEWSSRHQYW